MLRTGLVVAVFAFAGVAAALPGVACAPTCEVFATSTGFVPAVVAVDEEVDLVWRALDAPHTVTSGGCFHRSLKPGQDASLRFDVRGDELWVKQGDLDWTACSNAQRTGDGAFRIPYVCLDHPDHASGEILVVP